MTRITTCGTNWLAIIISPAWMYRLKKNSLSVSGASGAGGICRNTGTRSTRPASQRDTGRTPCRHGPAGGGTVFSVGRTDGGARGGDRTTQSGASDGMGRTHEQYPGPCDRDHPRRTDLYMTMTQRRSGANATPPPFAYFRISSTPAEKVLLKSRKM